MMLGELVTILEYFMAQTTGSFFVFEVANSHRTGNVVIIAALHADTVGIKSGFRVPISIGELNGSAALCTGTKGALVLGLLHSWRFRKVLTAS